MRNQTFLLLALAIAGLAGCDQHERHSATERRAAVAPGEIGSRLPDFVLTDLEGHSISAANFRGKVVLIDFWATWCAPCEKEMPGYQMLLDRYGPRGFAVVGLKADMMRDTEDPIHFARRVRIRYPLAVATSEINQEFGGIEGLPTTLLFDRSGHLRKKIIGFEYTEVVEKELKALL